MQDYKEKCKSKNLRFYTLMLKEFLTPDTEKVTDSEII